MGDDDSTTDSIMEQLEGITDEPPRETVAVEIDAEALPTIRQQLDEAQAADHFVKVKVGDAIIETVDEPVEMFTTQEGFMLQFPGGERALFPYKRLVRAAGIAIAESEVVPVDAEGDGE